MTLDSFGRTIANRVACPDCNAETRPVEYAPGVTLLQVFHDDMCPTYRAMQAVT